MPDTIPKVNRLDLTDDQLAFVALLLQSLQAKLNVNIEEVLATGQTIVEIHRSHPDVLLSIGQKVDALLSQEQYDKSIYGLLGVKPCEKCGGYHA